MNSKPIDVEASPADSTAQAVVVREQPGAVGVAMTLDELKANLAFIHSVMHEVMQEGQDYGKIPGCGDKPGLFQPGAQKLCMTFQLTDEVKEERVVDLGNHHREYSFVVKLTSKTGRTWEGVGTCSTLESKYRYRKAERRCPTCGKNTIIQGKAEYGGGWLCFKKKGGCGTKYAENDEKITSQPGGTVENENPADHWNTVRKMAFKRGLVHATINATNTSELWSQDLEDLAGNAAVATGPAEQPAPAPKDAPRPAQAPEKPTTNGTPKVATAATREWAIKQIESADMMEVFPEYLEALNQLLPTENVNDWPLRFVPVTVPQMTALVCAVRDFKNGLPAKQAFPPAPISEGAQKAPVPTQAPRQGGHSQDTEKAPSEPLKRPIEVPRDKTRPPDQEAWRTFPMPFGKHAGVILEELEKNYLYGLWANYTVEREYKGKPKKPETIAKDETFRAMLDLAGEHYQFAKHD